MKSVGFNAIQKTPPVEITYRWKNELDEFAIRNSKA
jgi:hypothetical protein